jgi:hypothetical protein
VYEAGTDKLLWFEELSLRAHQVQLNTYAYGETERHFGLGDRKTVDVTVHFYPSNKEVKKTGVAANSMVRIGEDGTGTIVMPPAQPPLPPRPAAADAGATAEAGAAMPPAPRDGGVAGPEAGKPAPPTTPPATGTTTGTASEPTADAGGDAPMGSGGCGCELGSRAPRPGIWAALLFVCVVLRQKRLKGRSASAARDRRAGAARSWPPAPSVIIDGAGRDGHVRGGGEAAR